MSMNDMPSKPFQNRQKELIDLSFPSGLRLPVINCGTSYDTILEEETQTLNFTAKSEKSSDQGDSPPLKLPTFTRRDSSLSTTTNSESISDTTEDDFITFDEFYDEQEEEEESEKDSTEDNDINGEEQQLEVWKRSVALTAKEEKEIERTVRKECLEEFQRIMKDTREKQTQIKKHFKKVIDDARKILVTARVQAESTSVVKLEEITEQKQEEIYLARERRKQMLRKSTDKITKDNISYKDFVRTRVSEMDALRKLQSNLDRARARKRNSMAAGVTVDKNGNVDLKRMAAMELRRLEKVKDIQTLVDELKSIGLEDKAIELQESLQKKAEFENNYVKELISEKKKARSDANERKRQEVEKLRKFKLSEKYAEKMRLERERREREERERQLRIAEAMKRRAFNLKLKQFYAETRMETSLSRPYSFSYF